MVSQQHSLVDVQDSMLVVIDVQESFLQRLPPRERKQLVNRIGWLVDMAVSLDVPLVVTAEDIPTHGGPVQAIGKSLPVETHVLNKTVFGVAGNPEIVTALKVTGRRTAVLVGLETDVCIAQSAVGLLDMGKRVALVADAVGSPGTGHELGLQRVGSAGALVLGVKGLYYEWITRVDEAVEFRRNYAG